MSNLNIKNLDFIRNMATPDMPDLGAKLYEALKSIEVSHNNIAQQVNANSTGNPEPPPAVDGLKVTGQNGHFSAAITDNNPVYRGVNYFLEHASNPQFTDPTVVNLGATRNHDMFLGNVQRYFRAYSSYSSSAPSRAAYHGTEVDPMPVVGGGSVGGPAFQSSQGSGTGAPGQGLSGPGPVPFRSTTGIPPVR
jgi:hypothetical protein